LSRQFSKLVSLLVSLETGSSSGHASHGEIHQCMSASIVA